MSSKEVMELTSQTSRQASLPRQQASTIALYLSWPAVSQQQYLACSVWVLMLSMPIVMVPLSSQDLYLQRVSSLVLPASLFPMMMILQVGSSSPSQYSLGNIRRYQQMSYCGPVINSNMEARRHQLNPQNEQEKRDYFEEEVRPVYSELIASIVRNKPEDILDYCTKWFRDRKAARGTGYEERVSFEDNGDEHVVNFETVPDQVFRQIKEENIRKARRFRFGVSSEKAGRASIKVEKGEKKKEETYMRILFFCMNSFLFRNFSEKETSELIQKMRREEIGVDEQVCKQGQYGDKMYFIDKGIFECVQHTEEGPRSLKLYYLGDTFGEICLLHMIKRQASIYSRDKGVVYSLDRQSYIHYKKMSIIKKRTLYLCTLMNQHFFSSFKQEELEKICDVLQEVSYEEGEMVINEGDVGTKFFIILDGILVAFKQDQTKVIRCYKEGDAFGQVALLKDTPRQASVKALTRCRMVYLTRETFRRIFENVNLQKDIDERYATKVNLGHKRKPDSGDQPNNKKTQKQQANVPNLQGGRRASVKPDKQALSNLLDSLTK